jgi:hypothetical protein
MRELKISKNSFGTLHESTQSKRPVATIGMSRFAADIASRACSVLLQACFEGKSKHYSQSRVMPPASKHCGKAEMKMKRLVNILFCVLLGLVVTSSSLFAQTATGAEAQLKEKNIILPPVPAPVANYVDSVRVGNCCFWPGTQPGLIGNSKAKSAKISLCRRVMRRLGKLG